MALRAPLIRPGVRFSKLPKTFRARKAILCAGYLPTEIQFSFVWKAKRKNLRSTRNFPLVFELKEIEFQKSLPRPKSLRVF